MKDQNITNLNSRSSNKNEKMCVNYKPDNGHNSDFASFYCLKEKVYLCETCYQDHDGRPNSIKNLLAN
jgi:hypothetical protein